MKKRKKGKRCCIYTKTKTIQGWSTLTRAMCIEHAVIIFLCRVVWEIEVKKGKRRLEDTLKVVVVVVMFTFSGSELTHTNN